MLKPSDSPGGVILRIHTDYSMGKNFKEAVVEWIRNAKEGQSTLIELINDLLTEAGTNYVAGQLPRHRSCCPDPCLCHLLWSRKI
jgi:hypothetical protein